jgi:hypothetical protein
MRHQETRITSIYSISNGEVDYRDDDSVLHLPEAKMTMQVKVCDITLIEIISVAIKSWNYYILFTRWFKMDSWNPPELPQHVTDITQSGLFVKIEAGFFYL